jgi:(4S)-4-hydroxy-5-phosphonooxypentane-2,3-dione isomerase
MHIALVHVHVRPDGLDAFQAATLENAANSRQEAGVVRFDVLRQRDDPERFVLVEVYRSPEDAAAHKETAHYRKWRDAVAPLMAAPRVGVLYANMSPSDAEW